MRCFLSVLLGVGSIRFNHAVQSAGLKPAMRREYNKEALNALDQSEHLSTEASTMSTQALNAIPSVAVTAAAEVTMPLVKPHTNAPTELLPSGAPAETPRGVLTELHTRARTPNFRVRYAALAYDSKYVEEKLLPRLASSMCQVEEFLVSSLSAPTEYTIYTSNYSDEPLRTMLNEVFPNVMPRVNFSNLDMDPNDKIRMAAYKHLDLNNKNLASVRRMMADVHLPATEDRLFIGTDVSFLKRPDDFLQKILQPNVVYMVDQFTFGGRLYKVAAYKGPQCSGLLGDFFYVPAGMQIPEEDVHKSLKFYLDLPLDPPRITPPCYVCDKLSHGLHAVDQFAWAMVLGKVSNGQCVSLDSTKYHHLTGQRDLEAVHDKKIHCAAYDHRHQRRTMLMRRQRKQHDAADSAQVPIQAVSLKPKRARRKKKTRTTFDDDESSWSNEEKEVKSQENLGMRVNSENKENKEDVEETNADGNDQDFIPDAGHSAGNQNPDTSNQVLADNASSQTAWLELITALYRRVNPRMCDQAADLVRKYAGQEEVLYKKICTKYRVDSSLPTLPT